MLIGRWPISRRPAVLSRGNAPRTPARVFLLIGRWPISPGARSAFPGGCPPDPRAAHSRLVGWGRPARFRPCLAPPRGLLSRGPVPRRWLGSAGPVPPVSGPASARSLQRIYLGNGAITGPPTGVMAPSLGHPCSRLRAAGQLARARHHRCPRHPAALAITAAAAASPQSRSAASARASGPRVQPPAPPIRIRPVLRELSRQHRHQRIISTHSAILTPKSRHVR